MKYAVIDAHVGAYSVAMMCRALDVARAGFYAWKRRAPSERTRRDRQLAVHVRATFAASRRRYGSPRVHAELRAQGMRVARKRVARLMREDGLCARPRRRFVRTTHSRHDQPVAPNLVRRQFDVAAPDQVWVADLTYLRTRAGFVYLAAIVDLFSRRVVGWAVSCDLSATVAVDALRRALAVRGAPAGLVHHSDRGVHYACDAYQRVLAPHGITVSMSRKGNCWDNAVAESFFSTLAYELEFEADWASLAAVEENLREYIDGFYNRRRRHSHNGYVSPVDFERRFHEVGAAT